MGLCVTIGGYGGQGIKSAGDLLVAALFREGSRVQGMPMFSPLQMGGPITYSLAIDFDGDRVVPTYGRDVSAMMHRRLFTDAAAGSVRPSGLILLNAPEVPDDYMGLEQRVAYVDGDSIARRLGLVRANVPGISTVAVGAFAKVTGVVPPEALEHAVSAAFPGSRSDNLQALQAGFESVRVIEPEASPANEDTPQ
jgi:pyruvate ferredoxin oxidoreductase gamma subunit